MSTQAVEFTRDAVRVAADLRHRTLIHTAMGKYEVKRDEKRDLFQDWPAARQLAAERKWEAVNHLDQYLDQFVRGIEARGTKVHWASTAEQARQIIVGIV